MNIFYLALWHLMVVVVVGEHHAFGNISSDELIPESRYKRMINIKMLMLNVKINGVIKKIKLLKTNQLLANINLPVWTSALSSSPEFSRDPDIMERDVGHFTMYHDYVTRSALVYFHKRREFDGIINMMYKIEGLSIFDFYKEHTVNSHDLRFFNVWEYFKKLRPNSDTRRTRTGVTCKKLRTKVYPELLIAVSYDMVQAIESKSKFPFYVKTISHIITVYNAVDMLFRFVRSADISLNIAAIVIETNENEWGFQSKKAAKSYVNANKINTKVRKFFWEAENILRRYSYDYIIYHTRNKLIDGLVSLHGIADSGSFEPAFKPSSNGYRRNVAIQDSDSYEHYPTIAHELSHIFGAEHDRIFNWLFQNPCDRSVMAACGTPNLCLKWSSDTEKTLEKFFSSPAHCILRNEPQSLVAEKPRIIFTEQEQCQCYGYETTMEGTLSKKYICTRGVRCLDKMGEESTELPFPMDGTPCDDDFNKVCWKKTCVQLEETKILSSETEE